ncbi:DUF2635 domain-containing protein [Agrobacterium rhizogenes]|uniref:DUF2635 domain-containing protein n=1 Tax=Rhizobium rhizogenes TaxID=359 RepID=UPI001573C6BE|nr:DUF2635 domain-containing protein [Rhizobium rhizogenes]NTF87498.1 DUF2635 domain-containing protein [Rhizobium rhizogenes]
MSAIYVPAPGKRIPMPSGQSDWPADGRPINELSPYERRLVLDGDLILKPAAPTKKSQDGETGGEK